MRTILHGGTLITPYETLPSYDLVIEDGAGHVLVGMRNNEPARGCWFVPGGRVFVGDSVRRALYLLDEKGREVNHFNAGNPPVGVTVRPEGLYLCIAAPDSAQPDILKRLEKWG